MSQDLLLIEFVPADASDEAIVDAWGHVASHLGVQPGTEKVWVGISDPRVTIYLPGSGPAEGVEELCMRVRERLLDTWREVEIARLGGVRTLAGASHFDDPAYHYVVRTDVISGGEEELERWYDEEHLPALAGVPGVVQARRLVSLDAPPRYYACYDLIGPHVREHDRWLTARATEWSHRVRPTFCNTRRIISRLLTPSSRTKTA